MTQQSTLYLDKAPTELRLVYEVMLSRYGDTYDPGVSKRHYATIVARPRNGEVIKFPYLPSDASISLPDTGELIVRNGQWRSWLNELGVQVIEVNMAAIDHAPTFGGGMIDRLNWRGSSPGSCRQIEMWDSYRAYFLMANNENTDAFFEKFVAVINNHFSGIGYAVSVEKSLNISDFTPWQRQDEYRDSVMR